MKVEFLNYKVSFFMTLMSYLSCNFLGEYYELDKEIVSCYTKMVDTEQEADEATSMEAYTSNKDSI